MTKNIDLKVSDLETYFKENNISKNSLLDCKNIDAISKDLYNYLFDEYDFDIEYFHDLDFQHKFAILFLNCLKCFLIDEVHNIEKIIIYFDNIKLPEQRTKEWFEDRLKRITGSEAGSILTGMKSVENDIIINDRLQTILCQKLGISVPKMTKTPPAILHGVLCEEITTRLYEQRFDVIVKEYGCLPHPDLPFIGASPDGIVVGTLNNDPSSHNYISSHLKKGTMLEIKNPFSRTIDNKIKFDYFIQIQMQLATTGLFICDFIESKINKEAYNSLNELLSDVIPFENLTEDNLDSIENKKIPLSSLSSNFLEKGVMLHFYKEDPVRDSNVSEVYPVNNKITEIAVKKWTNKMVKKYNKKGFTLVKTYYWRVELFSIKSVTRDDNYWETKIYPKLKGFWDIVEKNKKMNNNELKRLYSNLDDDKFGEEIFNTDDDTYIKRKLKKLKVSRDNDKEVSDFDRGSFKFSDDF